MPARRSKNTPVIEARSSRGRSGFGPGSRTARRRFPMSTVAAPSPAGIATSPAPSSLTRAALMLARIEAAIDQEVCRRLLGRTGCRFGPSRTVIPVHRGQGSPIASSGVLAAASGMSVKLRLARPQSSSVIGGSAGEGQKPARVLSRKMRLSRMLAFIDGSKSTHNVRL